MREAKHFSVVIADDQLMVAEGLAAVIEQYHDFKVIALVPNGEKLLHLLNNSQPDLILLDLNMPVMDGFTACMEIRKRFPKIVVVALTSYDDDKIRQRVLDAGATGMLLKYISSEELTDSLRKIMKIGNGQIFFSGQSVEAAATSPHDFDCDKFAAQYQLTEQQCKVMRLVADGLTSKEIADKICISKHTVDSHRKNIFQKLNLKNVIELIEFMNKYVKINNSHPAE